MANETNTTTPVDTQETNDYQEYIDQINELKRTSVSRAEYDKIKEENRTLLSNLVNGTTSVVAEEEPVVRESLDELRARVFNNPKNDLEYVAGILEIRDRVMEAGGADPFVNDNGRYHATEEDYRIAENTAEGLRHCVEVADGNNDVFLQEITRITRDTPVSPNNKSKRR